MKKLCFFLLALLLLAGCAGKPAAPSAPETPGAPATAAPKPAEPAETPAAEGLGGAFMAASLSNLGAEEVSLGELIGGNRLTLINIWATFCGPCIREMPDLGDLAREYADRGFGIVGLTCDVLDGKGRVQQSVVADALSILADTGADYPVLIMSPELIEESGVQYIPTSYFVDENGNILEGPLVGSMSRDDWTALIETYLAAGE